MAPIPGISGEQSEIGTASYEQWRQQYATSTHENDHDMHPGHIVRALNSKDIKAVIAYAKENGKAIAIRSGGHQYSGASSTGQSNIQLDLRNTFKVPGQDLSLIQLDDETHVRVSVSWSLLEFNSFLGANHLFVPHGQCQSVCMGGHAQTGGYGQLGRSFGLMGDHIVELEFIDHNGTEKKITPASHPDEFFAWTGGSPGNLGVLTHITLKVYQDADYRGSRGLKCLHMYTPESLQKLLQVLAEMNDDEDFPRNYDLCITVISEDYPLDGIFDLKRLTKQKSGLCRLDGTSLMSLIVIYAQWVPFSTIDKPDDTWFGKLKDGAVITDDRVRPMSELTAEWIFRKDREYNLPYVKRTYLTAATNLSKNGWVKWTAGRVDEVVKTTGHYIAAQVQPYGGKNSRFRVNDDGRSAYSWRDSTVVLILDNFYVPGNGHKEQAEAWAAINEEQGIGENKYFSTQDRRVLWGSWGSYNLHSVWPHYYEDEVKYQRIQRARKAADPYGVFTPNSFSVLRAD
ncbi:FAD-binding domain-containing protein [Trichoderma citrinoviride]|uniref:FAD-binding domain-containing protein n=1 Tax=Trichoderma citrinoviride TaxID=58853 RepID=A0A2T4B985_9HYPO|nr:FAD-binding domain-containing protein [Trichoderma citrinoviride]PTB65884.1 FAD-binding domain-containing protein [Trichoderma citrinoviride]